MHWVDSSLVDPEFDFYDSNKAVLVVDLETITKNEDDFIGSLARIVSNWNLTKEYSKTKYNCQHFAQDVIENGLGLKFKGNEHSDAVKIIIENLAKSGEYDLQSLFKNKEFSHLKHLKTHRDIDFYIISKESNGRLDKNEKLLLKAFDRAFWLNLFTSKEKLEDYTRMRMEHQKFIGSIDSIKYKILKKRLDGIFNTSFYNHPKFLKKHEKEMSNFRFMKLKIEDEDLNDDEISILKENLLKVWKEFMQYSEKRIPELEEQFYECLNITGKHVIKELIIQLMKDGVVDELVIRALYPDNEKYPENISAFEEYPLLLKYVNQQIYYERYDLCLCPFENPMETVSFPKRYK